MRRLRVRTTRQVEGVVFTVMETWPLASIHSLATLVKLPDENTCLYHHRSGIGLMVSATRLDTMRNTNGQQEVAVLISLLQRMFVLLFF